MPSLYVLRKLYPSGLINCKSTSIGSGIFIFFFDRLLLCTPVSWKLHTVYVTKRSQTKCILIQAYFVWKYIGHILLSQRWQLYFITTNKFHRLWKNEVELALLTKYSHLNVDDWSIGTSRLNIDTKRHIRHIPTLQSRSFLSTLQQHLGFLGVIVSVFLASFASVMSAKQKWSTNFTAISLYFNLQ